MLTSSQMTHLKQVIQSIDDERDEIARHRRRNAEGSGAGRGGDIDIYSYLPARQPPF